MRALALALVLAAGSASAAGPARRVWSGLGRTELASEDANWKGDSRPADGDRVVFGATSSKDCRWDFDVGLSSITLTNAYKGRVSLGRSRVELADSLRVAGGTFDLDDGTLRVRDRVYVDWDGAIELGRGELRLGPRGLLVDNDGRLSSTGHQKARITAGDGHYPFVVGRGTVRFANPSGTVVSGSKGIVIYSFAEVQEARSVEVREVEKGSPGLKLFTRKDQKVELVAWAFDETVEKPVESPNAERGEGEVVVIQPAPPAAPEPEEEAAGPSPPAEPAAPTEVAEVPYEEPETEQLRGRVAFTPLVDLEMLGGQYFFQGSQGALSGNARVLASGRIKHPVYPEWTFVPLYSGLYRGTKQVTDLVGGGTLFQELMEHRVALKAIYEPWPNWRLKPELSYKVQLLKETRDETWTNGLFDHRRPGFGVEAERTWRDPFKWRVGYDLYQIDFPNYVSLESQAKGTAGLARQLAGEKTIDSTNHALTFSGSAPGPRRTVLEGGLSATRRRFGDQHVVLATGDLSSDTRSDLVAGLRLSLKAPRRPREGLRVVTSLDLDYSRVRSNQNSYDAQRVRFLPDYYDTDQVRAGLGVGLFWGPGERPLEARLGAALGRTSYKGRPAQDSAGAYGSDDVRTTELYLSGSVRYPIAERFYWTGALQFVRQTSNMAYEKLYRYNYDSFAYLAGFSWEF